jgi:hypothetical protein
MTVCAVKSTCIQRDWQLFFDWRTKWLAIRSPRPNSYEAFFSLPYPKLLVLVPMAASGGAMGNQVDFPAMDLCGRKCARLRPGDYARETNFGDDPTGMAQMFMEQGAEQLRLIDGRAIRTSGLLKHELLEIRVHSKSELIHRLCR